jgi:PAS domain S-box-containing protein
MSTKDQPLQKSRSFSSVLLFYMVILVLCIVGIMAVNNYLYTRNNLEHEEYLLQVQTEQNIIEAMRLKNGVWNFYDKTLNDQMKERLLLVLQEYNRTGGDPRRMDLAAVKTACGKNYDIYIINESGVIIRTTYEEELGMDFKSVPYFYEYLTKIRNSEGFFADHIVRDKLGTGMLRKFAYMPTPDHRYILELGFASEEFDKLTLELADETKIEQIISINPYISKNFTIYNTMGRQLNNNELPDTTVQEYLSEVIKNRRTLEVSDPEKARSIRYLFVDLKFDEYGSDSSRIVELIYHKESIQTALFGLLLFHLLLGLTTIGIGCIIAFVLSAKITRPIQQIVQDVNIIASGDLEHRVGSTDSTEFTILENSTNTMVDSLKLALQHVKDGEILQNEMVDQLPVAVFMKSVKDGKYTFWNKASERIFNLSAAEVIGRTDHELFSQEMASVIEQEDKEAYLNHIFITNKKIENKYLGERIIHIIVVPIFDSKNNLNFILGISEDLTEEALTMKIGLLFSITRTGVLNQLSIIMTFLERAQLKMSREAMQTFFDKTVESVESIRNQMAFVRSLEEIGILSQKWLSVKKSFEDAVMLVSTTNIDISMEMEDVELYADPLLPWIFYHFLINSIRHGDHQLTKIRLHSQKSEENLNLIYEDNGIGIPDHEKEKVFEFGYDSRTGFGLFLIREILGYSGFKIIETGEYGKGIRFEIFIPKGKYRNPR